MKHITASIGHITASIAPASTHHPHQAACLIFANPKKSPTTLTLTSLIRVKVTINAQEIYKKALNGPEGDAING